MGHIQWICADFMKDCDLSQSAGWEFVIQLEDPGFFSGWVFRVSGDRYVEWLETETIGFIWKGCMSFTQSIHHFFGGRNRVVFFICCSGLYVNIYI